MKRTRAGCPRGKQGTWEQETVRSRRTQGSVSQQFQARKPADQQGRFCRRGLGPRGDGFLFGPFLLEWNRGAAVQIRTDVAPAPPDVVRAPDQLPLGCGP